MWIFFFRQLQYGRADRLRESECGAVLGVVAGCLSSGTLETDCAGRVGSLIDLLQGKLSAQVMEIITRRERGLFPKPAEIGLNCSCPDWARLELVTA